MTHQPTGFGRRSAPPNAEFPPPDGAAPGAHEMHPLIDALLHRPLLQMFVLISSGIIVVSLLTSKATIGNERLPTQSGTRSASSGSDGSSCRVKATAGGVFDIDWCEAAAAAARGAATGVAVGAGRR